MLRYNIIYIFINTTLPSQKTRVTGEKYWRYGEEYAPKEGQIINIKQFVCL
jgi:hypothetical protein